MFGTKDPQVPGKCSNEGNVLTLDAAVNFARTMEMSRAYLKSMVGEDKP